ncbi:MAG: GYD domain-containing protein [Acidimicrobiales bacterium]
MAKYLLEVSYTLEGIKGLKSEGGSARVAAATEAIEGLGGKIDAFYFAFGDTDVFVVADYPDNVSVAAAAIAVSAGGGAKVRTTVLLPASEIDAAVAKKTAYRPPGG